MVIILSDHMVKDEKMYIEVLKTAIEKAKSGDNLVTIGVKPTYHETEYDYIKFKRKINNVINQNSYIQGRKIYRKV